MIQTLRFAKPVAAALAIALLASCATLSKPVPAPAPSGEEGRLVALADALLQAIHDKDEAGLLALVDPEGGLTGAAVSPTGERKIAHIGWAAFAKRIATSKETVTERNYAPLVRVDGDLGMLWARYDVRADGKITTCGVNQFDFVRAKGEWKVASISFTRRATGCRGQ